MASRRAPAHRAAGMDVRSARDGPTAIGLPRRDARRRELEPVDRERALRQLLLEVGTHCAQSSSPGALAHGVLGCLVTGLDLAAGWVALPTRSGEMDVLSPSGPIGDASELLDFASDLASAPAADALPVRVPVEHTDRLSDEEGRGEGVFVRFRVRGPDRGWLLLVSGEGASIARDVDGVLPAVATLLGGSLARIGALASLRRLNRQLEKEVGRRTADLQREKETLEMRVRERSVELEMAKRAVLDSERRLLDLERKESVRQLAAGVAHELNNPLGAVTAAMDFLREELAELVPGHPLPSETLHDLREAVRDVGVDLARIRDLAAGLFGGAASSRRAAVRTDLDAAVEEAIRHFRRGAPPGSLVESHLDSGCLVGIPSVELTRWVFRMLSTLVGSRGRAVRVATASEGDERVFCVQLPGLEPASARETLTRLAYEIERASGLLRVSGGEHETRVRVTLPRASGEEPCRSGAAS